MLIIIYYPSSIYYFRVNEVLFAVTSNDILSAMASEEISSSVVTGNRIVRLANHMILQQSFVPQFPPSVSVLSQVCTVFEMILRY